MLIIITGFRRALNPNRLLLVAGKDGCPFGQIRFDLQATTDYSHSRKVVLDISIDRCARGLGLSVSLVRLGIQAMERRWGSDIYVVADVLLTNTASNACFERAGFMPKSSIDSSCDSIKLHFKRWYWHS